MSCDTNVSLETERFISEIIEENGLKNTSEVIYNVGSDDTDGFTSKTFTVDVSDGQKSLRLFCKVPLQLAWHENAPIEKMIANEIYFYNTIYPAYESFLKEHGVEDGLRNVPRCYGIRNKLIALENLKSKGYTLFDNKMLMNDDHFVTAFKSIARFHGISFAFKEQRRELHDTFRRNIPNCHVDIVTSIGYDKLLGDIIQDFLETLDPVEDERLLKASENLDEKLLEILSNKEKQLNENSIIVHGDCWIKNAMFLYRQDNMESPVDVMLLDWQLIRYVSPVFDLSFFFYPMASESTIQNLEYYLKEYHRELSIRIKELGSDPEALYPYSRLKQEWKAFAKWGFGLCFYFIKRLLMEKEEVPDLEDVLMLTAENVRNKNIINGRLKMLLKHFVNNDFL